MSNDSDTSSGGEWNPVLYSVYVLQAQGPGAVRRVRGALRRVSSPGLVEDFSVEDPSRGSYASVVYVPVAEDRVDCECGNGNGVSVIRHAQGVTGGRVEELTTNIVRRLIALVGLAGDGRHEPESARDQTNPLAEALQDQPEAERRRPSPRRHSNSFS